MFTEGSNKHVGLYTCVHVRKSLKTHPDVHGSTQANNPSRHARCRTEGSLQAKKQPGLQHKETFDI